MEPYVKRLRESQWLFAMRVAVLSCNLLRMAWADTDAHFDGSTRLGMLCDVENESQRAVWRVCQSVSSVVHLCDLLPHRRVRRWYCVHPATYHWMELTSRPTRVAIERIDKQRLRNFHSISFSIVNFWHSVLQVSQAFLMLLHLFRYRNRSLTAYTGRAD